MTNSSVYDLHSHSTFSDGQLTPSELIVHATNKGVTHLALTDHDTLAGLQHAQAQADKASLQLINGVELSCTWRGQLLHILGLKIDTNCQILIDGITENIGRRKARAELMHDDFLDHGIDLRAAVNQRLGDQGVPTRPHFADALIAAGYAKDKKQAFKRFLVHGKPGFIAMQWPSLSEVATWIKQAGGIAVLAHPMRYKLTRTKLIALIEEMKEAGIAALEVSTPSTNSQQIAMLSTICLEHDLLASMGSDFHSFDQPWARLGRARPLPDKLIPVWSRFESLSEG